MIEGMRFLFTGSFLFFASALSSFSKAEVLALDFYKSPESVFASGQASPQILEKFALRDHLRHQFLAERSDMTFWIEPEEIARDIDLSFRVIDLKTKSSFALIHIHPAPAQGRNEFTGKIETLDLEQLAPQTNDLGVVLALTPISLRKEKTWKSEFIGKVEPKERLRLLSSEEDWFLVSPLNEPEKKGWIEAHGPLTKFDFATHVISEGGAWTAVTHREGGFLISETKQRLPISKIRGSMTSSEMGITVQSLSSLQIPRKATLKLSKGRSREWVESSLPGHGRVFWRRASSHVREDSPSPSSVLSTEGLLRRPVTSVAFHPKKDSLGIASAEGIYLSQDGIIWQKLHMFETKNYPVAINEEGHIFVGPYKSIDSGASFQPFLKWEMISGLSSGASAYRHHPVLRLLRIEPLPQSKVRIRLDNGLKTWSMTGDARFGMVHRWSLD
jgi:hypothetical protein